MHRRAWKSILLLAFVLLGVAQARGQATATFLHSDTTTQGSWHGVYGADGYSIANDSQSIPGYATFAVQNQLNYTWASSTSDPRALQNGNNTGRIASTWYNNPAFNFDVNFTDGNSHQFAFYSVDWDSQGRSQTIQIVDANTSAVLDTRTISSFVNGIYLVWTISGHVRINITVTAANGVVSGVFFGGSGSGATASFVTSDTSTQGNWQGTYGPDGYSIANDSQSLPGYVSAFTVQNQLNYTWDANPSSSTALKRGSGSGRIAATWYNNPSFNFNLAFGDSNTHRVALYAIDWDATGRAETIQIADANTNAVLDTRSISSFTNGIYLVWNISGHVTITLTRTAGANAVISGVFFGGGGSSSPSLSITKTHTGNFTQGQQNATYTVTVSNATGAAATSGTVTMTETVPSNLTLVSMAGTGWSCASNTCTRSDALSGGSSYPALTVTVNVASNASSPQVNQVSVSGGGSGTASASDSTTINSGGGGASATFITSDTTTQGNWQGTYGPDGYSIANDSQSLPSYVSSFAVQNELNYTWDANPSSSTALKRGSGSGRIAATWYNNPSFNFNLAFGDSNTHRVALYAIDWDSTTRAETIQITDANTNAVLDTRSISSFTNGTYLVWNISGHVTITVTRTAGSNAVISGVFFGGSSGGGSGPSLSVVKTHTGYFTQGEQNATYTVTVSNASGAGATSGTVTMTETVPSGLTLVSMAGTGWSCGTTTCTRSDALNGGSSYPAITVTVNVASNASSPQVNQVSVSGGGSASANNSDSTTIYSSGGGPGVYYYLEDQLGTSRVIADQNGNLCYDADFYPFGGERIVVDNCPQNFKFTGKERDSESNLDNFGARYDSSAMGRFMSPDPVGGRRADPQTLNKYSYVRNNPLTLTDPTGLYTCTDDDNQCKTQNDQNLHDSLLQLRFSGLQGAAIAAQYGKARDDNGVAVDFKSQGDLGPPGTLASAQIFGQRGANGMPPQNVSVHVDFLTGLQGTELEREVAHEGSHLQDDTRFLLSFDFSTGKFNAALNFYEYDKEFKGFEIGAMVKPYENLDCSGGKGVPCGDIVAGPQGYGRLDRYLTTNPAYIEKNDQLGFSPKIWPQ